MKNEYRFAPARIGRAGEDIALQIEAAIVEGKIQSGDRLPSERKLQEQFRTGRGVIREALRALKQKGLIDIRKGAKGGAYIKTIEMANASESFALFLKQNRIDPKHLVEFRESIDHAITDLAIARASHEEKAALLAGTETLNAFLGTDEPDMEALIEQDRLLNIQFARMSRNPLFEWIMQALQIGFSSHDYGLYMNPDFREMTIRNWHYTAREIAANEPGKAHGYIGYHYVLLREALEERDITPPPAPDSDFWKDDTLSRETDAA